jgi:uncharacterized protein (TIGR03435 family)
MLRCVRNLILVGVAGVLVAASVVVPCGLARAQSATAAAPAAAFEVATVRVSDSGSRTTSISPQGSPRFSAQNASLLILTALAYGMEPSRISGPGWMDTQSYDVSAKIEGDAPLSYDQLQGPLQQLLAQRFHMVVHRETKDVTSSVLVVAKGGPKLTATKGVSTSSPIVARGTIRLQNMSITMFAKMLGFSMRQSVVDKTGIAGNYDIQLNFAPEGATDSQLPSIYAALQEQLGLKLESQKVPLETVVVDRVDKVPTEN